MSGSLVWQRCLGGRGPDFGYSVQQTAEGGYVVAGFSASSDGDVSGNHGRYDFWVVKLREINCTITAQDAVCSGSKGNTASTGESGATYAWSITSGEITSPNNARSISFTAGSQGTAALKVTVTKGGGSNECSKDITVTAGPDCHWTSNTPVCYRTPVRFNGPTGMDSYLWDFGDRHSSQEEDPRHIYLESGTYTVNLTVGKGGISKSCLGMVKVKPLSFCR
jgi:hypothetical protein